MIDGRQYYRPASEECLRLAIRSRAQAKEIIAFVVCRIYRKRDRIVIKEIAFFESMNRASLSLVSHRSRDKQLSTRAGSLDRISVCRRESKPPRSDTQQPRTRKSAPLSFCKLERSSIRRSRARALVCGSVFSFSVSLSLSSHPRQERGMRRGRFISTPVAIVPFVS